MILAIFLNILNQFALAQSCQEDLGLLFSTKNGALSRSTVDSEKAQRILGTLTEKQKMALSGLSERLSVYTATDIATETKLLMKAGFNDTQISLLRKNGILTNSFVKIDSQIPQAIKVFETDLIPLSLKEVQEIKKGQQLNYIISDDGRLFLSNKKPSFTDENLWIVKGKPIDGTTSEGFIARETGTLTFNQQSKSFNFNSNYGVGLADSELTEIVKQVGAKSNQEVKFTAAASNAENKVFSCLDILSAQNSGKNFILNRFIPDNAVTIAGIAIGEGLLGANRMATEKGREVIMADLIGTNANVIINGYIGSKLALGNSSFATSLGIRSAVGLGLIEGQKNIYENVLSEDAKARAENIATFDQYHFAGRLVWNHMFEKFLVGNTTGQFNLPNLIFKACQNNSKLKVLLNPQTVRFVERGLSAGVYYGLRQAVINE